VNKRRKILNVLFQWILLSRSSGSSPVGAYQRVGGTYFIVRVEPWTHLPLNVQCPRKQHQLIGRIVDWERMGRGISLSLYLPGGTEENRSAASPTAISQLRTFPFKTGGVWLPPDTLHPRIQETTNSVNWLTSRLPPGREWERQFSEVTKFRLDQVWLSVWDETGMIFR
jgi:hypothetical protein